MQPITIFRWFNQIKSFCCRVQLKSNQISHFLTSWQIKSNQIRIFPNQIKSNQTKKDETDKISIQNIFQYVMTYIENGLQVWILLADHWIQAISQVDQCKKLCHTKKMYETAVILMIWNDLDFFKSNHRHFKIKSNQIRPIFQCLQIKSNQITWFENLWFNHDSIKLIWLHHWCWLDNIEYRLESKDYKIQLTECRLQNTDSS